MIRGQAEPIIGRLTAVNAAAACFTVARLGRRSVALNRGRILRPAGGFGGVLRAEPAVDIADVLARAVSDGVLARLAPRVVSAAHRRARRPSRRVG